MGVFRDGFHRFGTLQGYCSAFATCVSSTGKYAGKAAGKEPRAVFVAPAANFPENDFFASAFLYIRWTLRIYNSGRWYPRLLVAVLPEQQLS